MRRLMMKWVGVLLLLSVSLSPAVIAPMSINAQKILKKAPGMSETAFDTALKAYDWALAHHKVARPGLLSVVDFDLPSSQKRLWVIDLVHSKVLMALRTAQGKCSGLRQATHFSNQYRSHESSLGVYTTMQPYQGKHGLSLKLDGLEPQINGHALARGIVVHPASYMTPDFIKQHHRAGLSWGCFALNPKKSQKFIHLVANGSVLFAYATAEQHDPNFN